MPKIEKTPLQSKRYSTGNLRPLTKKRGESKNINAAQTQIESFRDEKRRGRISKRQGQILELLETHEKISCREAAMLLGTFPSNLTAAFRNLEASGQLVVRSEKVNPATNKKVMLYELSGVGEGKTHE